MKVRSAESAHVEGDLARAERLLDEAKGRGRQKRREAVEERLQEVRHERRSLVERFYSAALAVETRGDERVAELLAWYEAAYALSLPSDPTYEHIRERLEELWEIQLDRLMKLELARRSLERREGSCETDLDAELRELVSLAYEADAQPPAELAWRLARVCFEEELYEQAASLAERARRLETFHYVPPPSGEQLVRKALSLHRTGVRGPLVAAVSEPEPAEEVVETEAESRPEARQTRRPQRRRPPPRRPQPEPQPEPEPAEEEIEEAEAEQELKPPTPDVTDALAEARRRFAEGAVHNALVDLDGAAARLQEHPEHHLIREQQEEWEEERSRLIQRYLGSAEAELAAQRPDDAATLYERILDLDPNHSLARDRLRRIERLRSLRE